MRFYDDYGFTILYYTFFNLKEYRFNLAKNCVRNAAIVVFFYVWLFV